MKLCKRGHPQTESSTARDSQGRNKGCKLYVRIRARVWWENNKDYANAQARKYYRENKVKFNQQVRRGLLKRKFGITPDQYDQLLESQKGLCANVFCRKVLTPRNRHLDHDHATKKVRGILCNGCNWALGNAKDSPAILSGLVIYLTKGTVSA